MTSTTSIARALRPGLALLAALALVATSCSDGGSDAQEVGFGLGRTAVESGMPDDPRPVRGGQLVYGLEAESLGYCLHSAQLAISGLQVARSIYDHLTVPDGKGGYAPYLASSITPSNGFRTWTIILRPDVVFHNGEKLTSQLVINNLEAYRKGALLQFVLANIKDIERVDDLTLKVQTEVPWVSFPATLNGAGRIGIMAQAQLDDTETCNTNPIGSGPFEFESWEPGESFHVRRFENYWQEAPDGEPYPYLNAIEFRVINNSDARMAEIHQGNINMMHTSTVRDMTNLGQLAGEKEVNLLVSEERTEVSYLMLRSDKPPFDDRDTRRAAAMAIDRHALNAESNGGQATVAEGPFAPGVMGYLEDTGFPEYDPEGAKAAVAALKAAGKPTSFTLTSTIDVGSLRNAALSARMLREAGFEVDFEVEVQENVVQRAIGGDFQMMAFRNQPGEDPDVNRVWWYGVNNPVNFGGFNNPTINENLDIGRSTADEDERREAYEAINREFADQVYNIWTWFAPWAVAGASNVHGILGPAMPDGTPASAQIVTGHPLHGIWIDGS